MHPRRAFCPRYYRGYSSHNSWARESRYSETAAETVASEESYSRHDDHNWHGYCSRGGYYGGGPPHHSHRPPHHTASSQRHSHTAPYSGRHERQAARDGPRYARNFSGGRHWHWYYGQHHGAPSWQSRHQNFHNGSHHYQNHSSQESHNSCGGEALPKVRSARSAYTSEQYDLGMERTLDGGKMDPRKCTPPHLLYNKAHRNDQNLPQLSDLNSYPPTPEKEEVLAELPADGRVGGGINEGSGVLLVDRGRVCDLGGGRDLEGRDLGGAEGYRLERSCGCSAVLSRVEWWRWGHFTVFRRVVQVFDEAARDAVYCPQYIPSLPWILKIPATLLFALYRSRMTASRWCPCGAVCISGSVGGWGGRSRGSEGRCRRTEQRLASFCVPVLMFSCHFAQARAALHSL